MTYREKLLDGLAVEIIVLEGEYSGKYRTRIEEAGERLLTVGAPIEKGEVVPLREGTKVEITFSDELAAYVFEAKIIQRIAVPVPTLLLEIPDSITKIQRRNYVRVPASYPISFRMVTGEGLSKLYQGTMLDMSGGGVRFLTEENIEDKGLLFIRLGLPNGDIQTHVRVLRIQKEEGKRNRVQVEFKNLSERERDQIIRCVFDLQREIRKKGLK